ncbi:MAG: replication-associated recombination protein A [Planctomycetota bacterium]
MAAPHRPPLAERMRPNCFDELVGQRELFGPEGLVRRLLREGRPPSLILWGPPGCGKTTVARLIAGALALQPVAISAVTSGVKELKEIIAAARASLATGGAPTLLFVDELHRFNKAQQDSFLGPVEDGTLILIGATTENPSFELNAPLLSRCRVLVLKELGRVELRDILHRALTDRERGLGDQHLRLAPSLEELLIDSCAGDARALLTDLEWLAVGLAAARRESSAEPISPEEARDVLTRLPRYDKNGDEHFNTISALHKSLRASDVQAGLYYLARMLESGDDPLYVARRLVRFATEDIGAADPQALVIAIAARDAVHFLGMPEGALALAELVVYLATAPKSDRVYRAYNSAADIVRRTGNLPIPLDVRNAPTRLMKELGYGAGYQSPQQDAAGWRVTLFPAALKERNYYEPREIGFEREIAKRMRYYDELRSAAPREQDPDAALPVQREPH